MKVIYTEVWVVQITAITDAAKEVFKEQGYKRGWFVEAFGIDYGLAVEFAEEWIKMKEYKTDIWNMMEIKDPKRKYDI